MRYFYASFRYCLDFFQILFKLIFSRYHFYLLIAKKSKKEISGVFSAFRDFLQNRKMSTFFLFLCSASLTESFRKMARNVILGEHFWAIVEVTFEFGALLRYGAL